MNEKNQDISAEKQEKKGIKWKFQNWKINMRDGPTNELEMTVERKSGFEDKSMKITQWEE